MKTRYIALLVAAGVAVSGCAHESTEHRRLVRTANAACEAMQRANKVYFKLLEQETATKAQIVKAAAVRQAATENCATATAAL